MITKDTFKTLHIPENFSYDFWNNASQIKAYCEGVLSLYPHTKDIKVGITINGNEAFVQKYPNVVSITLPRISLTNDDSYKLKNIIARTAFLRHEIAHVIFTDLNNETRIKNDSNYKKYFAFYNLMDDIRIENLFARDFKGTFNLFRSLYKAIYYSNMDMFQKYFDDSKNVYSFGYYCRVKEKRLRINSNTFDALYEKYRFIFYIEDYNVFASYVKEIIAHFEAMKPTKEEQQTLEEFFNQNKQQEASDEKTERESKESDSESDDQTYSPDPEGENSDDVEESEEGQANETNDEESDYTNAEDEDEEGQTDEKQEDDDDSDPSDIETSKPPQQEFSTENKQDKDLPSAKINDDSDKEADEEENSLDNDSALDSDDEQEEDDIVTTLMEEDLQEDKINTFDINSILKEISSNSEIFDFQQYQFNPNDFESATMINYNKLIPHINFLTKDGMSCYRQVVNDHKKTITETINFLKLKLKIRSNDKVLNWQVDGKLDQKNIKEILINKESPNVFFQNIKNIKTESEFYLMIDFSGSMSNQDRKNAVVTAIILIEICKALNIKYDINFFAGTELMIYHPKNTDAIIRSLINDGLTKDNIYIGYSRSGNVKVISTKTQGKIVAKLKNINEPHSVNIENIFGSLISPEKARNIHFISGGTPEFQSVLGLIKSNNHKTASPKNIFIINDGQFHAIQELYDINKINFQRSFVSIDIDYFKLMDKKTLNAHIINTYKSIIEFNIKMHKERKDIFDYDQIERLLEAPVFKNPDIVNMNQLQNYTSQGSKIVFNYDRVIGINFLTDWAVDNYAFFDIGVYKKMIEYAKTKNFNVYGFGIRSDLGKAYLGDKFTVFRDSKQIKDDFALKVRQIF